MAIAMIGFYFLRSSFDTKKMKIMVNPTVLTLLAGWIIMIIISIYSAPPKPYNTNPPSALQSYNTVGYMYLIWILLDIILMWVVAQLARRKRILTLTIRILIYSSVIYSLYGIYQYCFASFFGLASNPIVYAYNYDYLFYDFTVRLLSLSREPLYFANFICPVIIIISSILLTKSSSVVGIPKKYLLAILSIDIAAFFLTKSTGGFLALCGTFGLILVIHYKSHIKRIGFKRAFLGFSGLILAAGVFYYLFGAEVQSKLLRLADPNSGYTRIVSIIEAIENIAKNPVYGFGLGHAYYFISVTQIHNAYLSIAAETGLISLFCFLSFLVFLGLRLFRSYKIGGHLKGIVLGISGAFVYILIQWLSFYAYIILFAWFLFGIIIALPSVIKSSKHKVIFKSDN